MPFWFFLVLAYVPGLLGHDHEYDESLKLHWETWVHRLSLTHNVAVAKQLGVMKG